MARPGYSLSRLAELLGLPIRGVDADFIVSGVNTLEDAGPSDLSFLANPRYISQLESTRAGAVIVRPDLADAVKTALVSDDPYPAFARAVSLFAEPQGGFIGLSPLASIHPEARLGRDCTVYPFAYIGPRARLGDGCVVFPGCYIGEDCLLGRACTLYPNSVLMAASELGDHCVLQPGAVIGGEGFGFTRTPAGIRKIPQIGRVVLGDRVEVGVNSAVDRAALSETRVGDGTCIDNLVQIGHNVRIGRDCMLVAQVGISGSTKVGDKVTMAGQAGVAGHLTIGDNVTIGPQSGVPRDIADNQTVSGTPPVDYQTFMRTLALMPRFPELFKRLARVEKALDLGDSSQKQP